MFQSSKSPVRAASRRSWLPAIAVVAIAIGLAACGKKGEVYFANLQDGAEVESPFTVEMGARDLVVEPAANGVGKGRGHFHILVDSPIPSSDDPIVEDEQHIHYSQGETQGVLDLTEGDHTLILLFAKGDHTPYKPEISQEINIRVTRRNPPPMPDGMMPGDTTDGLVDPADSLGMEQNVHPGAGGAATGGGMNQMGM
jgi:predicted small lipoprotein YifL